MAGLPFLAIMIFSSLDVSATSTFSTEATGLAS
jgi:hypothetical protein